MATKTIQLTDIDNTAIWIDKQGDKHLMADMSDKDLQDALTVCQTLKLKAYISFKANSKREIQLKKVAKDRNMNIQDIDYIKPTWFGNKYCQFKESMVSAYNSILRKAKQIEKV